MSEGNGKYKTSDLSVAAYMHMRGLHIDSAKRGERSGRGASFKFVLDDPEGKVQELLIEFTNSESSRYDQSLRTVKRLVFD